MFIHRCLDDNCGRTRHTPHVQFWFQFPMSSGTSKTERESKWVKVKKVKKVKADIALHGNPTSELRDVTCRMGSHSVTCSLHKWTPPSHAGRYSIYLPRRDGRLSWLASWLDSAGPGRESNQRPFDHQSDAEPLHNQDNQQFQLPTFEWWPLQRNLHFVHCMTCVKYQLTSSDFTTVHGRTSQGVGGTAAPQTRGKPLFFRAKAKFFGQKPVANNEKNVFLYLLNDKNGIHSV